LVVAVFSTPPALTAVTVAPMTMPPSSSVTCPRSVPAGWRAAAAVAVRQSASASAQPAPNILLNKLMMIPLGLKSPGAARPASRPAARAW
jgi:hypothetical protein